MSPSWKGSHNVFGRIEGRRSSPREAPWAYEDSSFMRGMQMHEALVRRLTMETEMEGHTGCVNTIAWNKSGTLLVSGSDDQKVNIWDYGARKLVHSISSRHTQNIFCSKFMPESGDDLIISGAGDCEVRLHRVSRTSSGPRSYGGAFSKETGVYRCHSRRVKKLAVEEGNPHVIWSASEDGTLRQHDLREGNECCSSAASGHEDCRSVLLDLRSGAKKSLADPPADLLALKSCALSSTRPHYLLVGGSDAFARLFDRRMLSPLASASQGSRLSRLPPCVCYFAPAHLSDHGGRSGLHLTHVAFSPNGEEVLLSYSGEHVYLMDMYNSKGNPVVYRASDVLKANTLDTMVPFLNGSAASYQSQVFSSATAATISGWMASHRAPKRSGAASKLMECLELLRRDRVENRSLTEGESTEAICLITEVLVNLALSDDKESDKLLKHDLLIARASAFIKRNWQNDSHMAMRDCNEARCTFPRSATAHHHMSLALSQAQRYADAVEFSKQAVQLDPTNGTYAHQLSHNQAKLTAEENKLNCGRTNGEKSSNGSSRRGSKTREITGWVKRLDPTVGREEREDRRGREEEDEPQERQSREEEDDDELGGMDLELEMSVGDGDEGREEPSNSERQVGRSVSFRWRRKGDLRRESSSRQQKSLVTGLPIAGPSPHNGFVPDSELVVDMRQRFVGHCNTGTDIKQASFLGDKGEYIASGSDDKRWFIWEKTTGRLVKMLQGDQNVVNCVQCHPFDCAIATSGIDDTIKLWTPCGAPSIVSGGPVGPETGDTVKAMSDNQKNMVWSRSPLLSWLSVRPAEMLQRLRVQETLEGSPTRIECTPS